MAIFAALLVFLYWTDLLPTTNWDPIFGKIFPWIVPAFLILVGGAAWKYGWFSKSLLLAGAMTIAWNIHSTYYPPENAGPRMVTRNMDTIVVKHSEQVENETFKQLDCAHDSKGRIDLRKVDKCGSVAATQVAEARLMRDEKIAEAEGHLLKPKAIFLPGSQSSWLPTDIPIKSCMHIWVSAGRITYGTYDAGPDGVDLGSMSEDDRRGWLKLNGDRQTLMPNIRWGTPLIQACTDIAGKDCGPSIPVGAGIYVSPKQIGDGQAWFIANGFVSGPTGAGLLLGLKQVGMTDYNSYGGGFRIDREKAENYMCEQSTLVAQR
jgi:hypothetical protein